jgi:hypothetical protein
MSASLTKGELGVVLGFLVLLGALLLGAVGRVRDGADRAT